MSFDADAYQDMIERITPTAKKLREATESGLICADCGSQFTEKSDAMVCCSYCKNHGSELPVSKHPEVNKEAHRNEARKRKQRRASR